METEVLSRDRFGGSLPVENVQALASKNLKNIPSRNEVIEKMKVHMQEFFKLPLQEKMACAQLPNNLEGYGQAIVVLEDQKLD
ncbi:hypothetical protein PTKIN_Ptkin08bG0088800 [Pterospermum kingtungense]